MEMKKKEDNFGHVVGARYRFPVFCLFVFYSALHLFSYILLGMPSAGPWLANIVCFVR